MNGVAHLQHALQCAEAADRLGLLDHLLEAWRETRATAIADVIDTVGGDLERSLAPVAECGPRGERAEAIATQKARHQRWMDLCGLGRAADVNRLVKGLEDSNGPLGKDKMERLRNLPHDPRFATGLVQLIVRDHAWTHVPKTFRQLYGYLEEAKDVRGLPQFEKRLEQLKQASPSQAPLQMTEQTERIVAGLAKATPAPLSKEASMLVETIAEAAKRLAATAPLSEQEALADRRPAAAPHDGDEALLLEMVYANPTDDSARQVYGDWLSDRGDPRGELIALQFKRRDKGLTGKEEKRERELLKESVRSWLGPLEAVLDLGKRPGQLGSVVFERGFLAGCRTTFKSATQRTELIGERRWSTCIDLLTDEPGLVAHPQMKALRTVGEMPLVAFAELVKKHTAATVEELGLCPCRAKKGLAELLQTERAREALPSLKRIALDLNPLWRNPRWGEEWDLFGLVQAPLFQNLEEVRIELGGLESVASWLERMAPNAPSRLVLFESHAWRAWHLLATRANSQWTLVLSGLRLNELGEPIVDGMLLDTVAPAGATLTLEIPAVWTDAQVMACAQAFSRFSPEIRRV